MGSDLFTWLGRGSSFLVFMLGGLEVVPPLPPPPPLNIMGTIFLLVVAMIFLVMGETIGKILRNLDVLATDPDATRVVEYAKAIFDIFGMATTQISSIAKATIIPNHTGEREP